MNVFLDTNVLLDVAIKRDPFYDASAQVFSLVESGKIAGFISVLSLPNCYYFVRKMGGDRDARLSLKTIRNTFGIINLTTDIVDQAMHLELDDFEDAIQYVSAMACEPSYLVTRNVKHFPRY